MPPKEDDNHDTITLLKKSLKLLLFRLAAKSDTPSSDLERILQEVITELYTEAQAALQEKRSRLTLIAGGSDEAPALSASTP